MATGFNQLNSTLKYIIPSFRGRLAYDDFNLASLWTACVFLIVYIFIALGIMRCVFAGDGGVGAGTVILFVVSFAAIIVGSVSMISLFARRLHDTGRSGHWLWLSLAGLSIIPLVLSFGDTVGDNEYGKGSGNAKEFSFNDLKKAVKDLVRPIDSRMNYKEFALSTVALGFFCSLVAMIICLVQGCVYFFSAMSALFSSGIFNPSIDADLNPTSTNVPEMGDFFTQPSSIVFIVFFGIVCIVMLVFFIRLTILRLHDTGRSGRVYWWSLIPVFGICVPLILIFCDSDEDNEYGPKNNPIMQEADKKAVEKSPDEMQGV